MSNEKSSSGLSWWAGSFPIWIVLLLLGIISYAGQSVLANNAQVHSALLGTVTINSARITRLEEQLVSIRESHARIERTLAAIETLMRARP